MLAAHAGAPAKAVLPKHDPKVVKAFGVDQACGAQGKRWCSAWGGRWCLSSCHACWRSMAAARHIGDSLAAGSCQYPVRASLQAAPCSYPRRTQGLPPAHPTPRSCDQLPRTSVDVGLPLLDCLDQAFGRVVQLFVRLHRLICRRGMRAGHACVGAPRTSCTAVRGCLHTAALGCTALHPRARTPGHCGALDVVGRTSAGRTPTAKPISEMKRTTGNWPACLLARFLCSAVAQGPWLCVPPIGLWLRLVGLWLYNSPACTASLSTS